MRELSNYRRFLEIMRDPPCKLYVELDNLLLNNCNNNPYTLYRRNRIKSTNSGSDLNVSLNNMWANESHEVKEFYRLLAVEGNRRFKLKYQQLLQLQSEMLQSPLQSYAQPCEDHQLQSQSSLDNYQLYQLFPNEVFQQQFELYGQYDYEYYVPQSQPLFYQLQPQPQPQHQPLYPQPLQVEFPQLYE
ncbi:hypothetical protein GLOIN_2v1882604 [Rhizophagus clarus]|uniref:MATA-HMG n=1 Tax=Rhizophagus clarus TaxID=94130 RepID=A0A8H3L6I2_9GLOM|nr:hypothetical protein GLOIN_2v1882604 [Rhizophagus clarus]